LLDGASDKISLFNINLFVFNHKPLQVGDSFFFLFRGFIEWGDFEELLGFKDATNYFGFQTCLLNEFFKIWLSFEGLSQFVASALNLYASLLKPCRLGDEFALVTKVVAYLATNLIPSISRELNTSVWVVALYRLYQPDEGVLCQVLQRFS